MVLFVSVGANTVRPYRQTVQLPIPILFSLLRWGTKFDMIFKPHFLRSLGKK